MQSGAMKPTGASRARTIALTVVAMLAFAANSILCRLALTQTDIDPATFTFVRIGSGAAMLWAIIAVLRGGQPISGSWQAAFALFAYAAAFSFAYLSLPAGAGALLLFGAVQATMVIAGIVGPSDSSPMARTRNSPRGIGRVARSRGLGASLARAGSNADGGNSLGRLLDFWPAQR
jgi:hypothetical protein